MGTVSQLRATEARIAAAANGSAVGVASDSEDWFGSIARELLGKDAGFGLHLATGAPEGSCYKYVTTQEASRRQPPGFLIRQLLRRDDGWPWLCALMEGSDAEWWRDLQRTRRIAEAIASVK